MQLAVRRREAARMHGTGTDSTGGRRKRQSAVNAAKSRQAMTLDELRHLFEVHVDPDAGRDALTLPMSKFRMTFGLFGPYMPYGPMSAVLSQPCFEPGSTCRPNLVASQGLYSGASLCCCYNR